MGCSKGLVAFQVGHSLKLLLLIAILFLLSQKPSILAFIFLSKREINTYIFEKWGARRGSNPRPPESQSGILTNWTTSTISKTALFDKKAPKVYKKTFQSQNKIIFLTILQRLHLAMKLSQTVSSFSFLVFVFLTAFSSLKYLLHKDIKSHPFS